MVERRRTWKARRPMERALETILAEVFNVMWMGWVVSISSRTRKIER